MKNFLWTVFFAIGLVLFIHSSDREFFIAFLMKLPIIMWASYTLLRVEKLEKKENRKR